MKTDVISIIPDAVEIDDFIAAWSKDSERKRQLDEARLLLRRGLREYGDYPHRADGHTSFHATAALRGFE